MDDGLVLILPEYADEPWGEVLILVVVDDGLVRVCVPPLVSFHAVLILVVVDDGLVLPLSLLLILFLTRLNPCCSGRWSRTILANNLSSAKCRVLILVVVDDGLVPSVYARSVLNA